MKGPGWRWRGDGPWVGRKPKHHAPQLRAETQARLCQRPTSRPSLLGNLGNLASPCSRSPPTLTHPHSRIRLRAHPHRRHGVPAFPLSPRTAITFLRLPRSSTRRRLRLAPSRTISGLRTSLCPASHDQTRSSMFSSLAWLRFCKLMCEIE